MQRKFWMIPTLSLGLCILSLPQAQAQFKEKLKGAKESVTGGSKKDADPAPGTLAVTGSIIQTAENKTAKVLKFRHEKSDYPQANSYALKFTEAKGLGAGLEYINAIPNRCAGRFTQDSVFEVTSSWLGSKNEKGEKIDIGQNPYHVRVIKLGPETFMCYYGKGNTPPRNLKDACVHIKPEEAVIAAVFAPTKAEADEWYGDKGKAWIKDFESKVMADVAGAQNAVLANKRMPAAGKMQQDQALLKDVESLLRGKCERDNTTFRRAVITSADWTTAKHKKTGVPLYRWVTGYFVDQKPGRSIGEFMIFSFNIKQEYDGVGGFSSINKLDCCGQDGNTGPIDGANIDK